MTSLYYYQVALSSYRTVFLKVWVATPNGVATPFAFVSTAELSRRSFVELSGHVAFLNFITMGRDSNSESSAMDNMCKNHQVHLFILRIWTCLHPDYSF